MRDLRALLAALREAGDLAEVDAEVDPRLEIPEIHRRVIEAGGPALLFKRPRGGQERRADAPDSGGGGGRSAPSMPVVTNLFGTMRRIELAFGNRPLEFVKQAVRASTELLPPTPAALWRFRSLLAQGLRVGTARSSAAPVTEVVERDVDLTGLPALTQWVGDGGPFLTLPLVYTEHPERHESNLGMYRMQVHDRRTFGMHFQIGKGGGFHLHAAEAKGQALPVTVFLGGPPALILGAIAPLPEGVPELLLVSLLLGERLGMTRVSGHPHRLVAGAEMAFVGKVPPGIRRPEGPFGDHYGYYSLRHDYPVFEVDTIYRRSDAIFPATVVGKPRQEDFFIGDFLQELLSPLFPLVMPSVVDLWSYGDTGFHSLAAAVVKDRYRREALASAFRILGEGQLSLTKFLLLTDARLDLRSFRSVLEHLLARCRFETDLFVFSNLSMDTLDYTGPRVNEGSKGVLVGLGESVRDLPRELPSLPAGARDAHVFCPGCLVVDGPSFAEDGDYARTLARSPAVAAWPLIALVDDARFTASSERAFLWSVFTRFEPGADLCGSRQEIVRNHVTFAPPVVIDARTKTWMPETVETDPETARLVDRRWREYFPGAR